MGIQLNTFKGFLLRPVHTQGRFVVLNQSLKSFTHALSVKVIVIPELS